MLTKLFHHITNRQHMLTKLCHHVTNKHMLTKLCHHITNRQHMLTKLFHHVTNRQHMLTKLCHHVTNRQHRSGADPGFQVGGTLKKIATSGGRREHFWGISCEKSRFYATKSYFFQF